MLRLMAFKMFRVIVLVVLWLPAIWAGAEPASMANINQLETPNDLSAYTEVIVDKDLSLSYVGLAAGEYEHLWQKPEGTFVGYTPGARYWFRIRLNYNAAVANQEPILWLRYPGALVYKMDVWIPDDSGDVRTIATGFLRPYKNRDIPNLHFAFRLPSAADAYEIIGSIYQNESVVPVRLPLLITSAANFQKQTNQSLGGLIAFYAIMLALLLYNFCLFAMLKQRMYGYYCMFMTCLIMDISVLDNTSLQYLWPSLEQMNFRLLLVNSIATVTLYNVFVWEALDGLKFAPLVRKGFIFTYIIGITAIIYNSFTQNYMGASIFSQVVPTLTVSLTFIAILVAVYKKIPGSNYLFFAEVGVTCGTTSFMLMIEGVSPVTDFTLWGMHWGFLTEAMLLSLMLADRTRKAQNAALQNLESYEMLFERSNEGLFQYSIQDKNFKINSSFARLMGYPSVEAFSQERTDFSDGTYDDLFALLRKHNGVVTGYHYNLRSPRVNEVIWVSVSMQLIKNDEGRPALIDGSMIDVTQAKQKEEAERKRELAEEKVKAESEFLAAMSHEIRTPMNGVIGVCQLLLDMPLEAEVRKYVHTISKSGDALLTIINDILDLKKIEAGKMQIEGLEIDLENLIDDCLAVFPAHLTDKPITLMASIDHQCARRIKGDPTRIRQILLNFLSNAYKFTERGAIEIKVQSIDDAQGNAKQIRFEVKDSGIGLTQDQQAKLFQSYSQAEAGTSRKYGGTGLGLSICKQLAELMGGTIGVDSLYGEGSVFWFTITSETVADHHAEKAVLFDKQKKALILSHNLSLIAALQSELNYWGLQHETDFHATALDLLRLASYDVCFCDNSYIIDNLSVEYANKLIVLNPPERSRVVKLVSHDRIHALSYLPSPITFNSLKSLLFPKLGVCLEQAEEVEQQNTSLAYLKVLVAEDNPTNQLVIKGMLKKFAIEPIIVENGVEALGAVKTKECAFDLILMDCDMPLLDGYEATEKIRGVEQGLAKRQYIVALSAHAMLEQKEKAFRAGMDDYMVKPVKLIAVKKILDKVAEMHAQSSAQSSS